MESTAAVEDCADQPATPTKQLSGQAFSSFCVPHAPRRSDQLDGAASLEHYIRCAAMRCSVPIPIFSPVFSQSSQCITSISPLVRLGKPNRILVFAGCFNPPHLGHLELLAHVFLRADCNTIAVMLIPVGDLPGAKGRATVKGEVFKLAKGQRSDLLRDEVLGRFSWIYSGNSSWVAVDCFQTTMANYARADGYELSFTGLTGSDHCRIGQNLSTWGNGNLITSDITRPSDLMAYADAQPTTLRGCGQWRKILPAKSVSSKGHAWCWPCWKFQAFCPELAGKQIPADGSCTFLSGIASQILLRCHDSDGKIWMCHQERGGIVWFIPSGRHYPDDGRRSSVSSTSLRTILDQTADSEAYDAIKTMVMNPMTLLSMLRQQQYSKQDECAKVTAVAEAEVEVDTGTALVLFEGAGQ